MKRDQSARSGPMPAAPVVDSGPAPWREMILQSMDAAERCCKSHPQPVTGPCSVRSMWVGVRSMCSVRLPGRVFAPGHRRTGRTAPRQRFPSSPGLRCRIRVFLHAIPGRWRPVVLAGIAPGGGRWGAMTGWLHGARAALASMVSGRRTGFGTTRGSSTSPRRLTAAAGSSDSSGTIAGRRSPVAGRRSLEIVRPHVAVARPLRPRWSSFRHPPAPSFRAFPSPSTTVSFTPSRRRAPLVGLLRVAHRLRRSLAAALLSLPGAEAAVAAGRGGGSEGTNLPPVPPRPGRDAGGDILKRLRLA